MSVSAVVQPINEPKSSVENIAAQVGKYAANPKVKGALSSVVALGTNYFSGSAALGAMTGSAFFLFMDNIQLTLQNRVFNASEKHARNNETKLLGQVAILKDNLATSEKGKAVSEQRLYVVSKANIAMGNQNTLLNAEVAGLKLQLLGLESELRKVNRKAEGLNAKASTGDALQADVDSLQETNRNLRHEIGILKATITYLSEQKARPSPQAEIIVDLVSPPLSPGDLPRSPSLASEPGFLSRQSHRAPSVAGSHFSFSSEGSEAARLADFMDSPEGEFVEEHQQAEASVGPASAHAASEDPLYPRLADYRYQVQQDVIDRFDEQMAAQHAAREEKKKGCIVM